MTAESASELLQLALREGGEEAFLRRLLERLRSVWSASALGLYLESHGFFTLSVAVGEGTLAESLSREDAGEAAGILLAPGLVMADPPEAVTSAPAEELLIALASGIRSLELRQRLKKQRFEVNYRGVELEALYDVGLAIASTLNLEELSEEILLRAVSLLDARRGALYLVREGGYSLDQTFGGEARKRIELDDVAVADLLRGDQPSRQELLPGSSHLMAEPIEADGAPLGLLVVGDKESRRGVGPFREGDRRTMSLLANQAAIALENARLHQQALEKERLERELELAADIQRRLLPTRLPEIDGFDLLGWSRAARHVGGDFYDLLELPGGNLGAVVADVSGKGMPAALLVSTLHSALRLLLDRLEPGGDLLTRLNQHILSSSAPNRFITLMLAELDPRQCVLKYVNAGHNPAILLRRDKSVLELAPSGMPLGLFPWGSYRTDSVGLEPGDLLCLYSDGITEASSPEEEEFGTGRLIDLLRDHGGRPLAEVVRAIEQAATRFTSGKSQGDDQTLLLLRRV